MTVDTVRVLIVDDQAAFRSAARLVVEMSDGFEVVGEAETAEDGFAQLQQLHPDLVLMDVNLPGIDGLEATRLIVQRPEPPVVVVLSTYAAGEYAERAIAAGAANFISKSDFDPLSLESAWEAARSR